MSGNRIKHDWYQTEQDVVVSVLARGLAVDGVAVEILETTLSVTARLQDPSFEYDLHLNLCHPVVPDLSSYLVLPSKVEIKLRKGEQYHWSSLEGDGRRPHARSLAALNRPPPAYPSSSLAGRDWDAIATQMRLDEEREEPQGEEAVNKLFQKIYTDGSDEVKKAMVKSFTESGGTVLSTNWSDIGAKKTDVKPPDGMEFKNWEQ